MGRCLWMWRCQDADAQDGEMQRCPGCRDAQDTDSEMPGVWRCPGCRDTEIAGIQRCRNARDAKRHREQGRAPATTNTCVFGLHTLTPGASSKENLGLGSWHGQLMAFTFYTRCACKSHLYPVVLSFLVILKVGLNSSDRLLSCFLL